MTTTIENTPAAWSARSSSVNASWEAALWSEAGQTQRFLAVLAHLELRAGDSLLDFGCGTGRFRAFVPREVGYFAYDTAPGMLARAAEQDGVTALGELPDALFDHVVAVGPFNLADGCSTGRTFETVADLWANHTRRTLAVSLYRGDDPACISYDPMTVARWAGRLGCHRFAVDASYLDNDLLLVLRRGGVVPR